MDDREVPEIPVPITNELERRIAEAFEIFDHGGNKTIDIREVGTVVRALGCCPSEAEIQEILIACEDLNMPGSIHLSKFLPHVTQMLMEHRHEPASPEKLLEAFHVLDPEAFFSRGIGRNAGNCDRSSHSDGPVRILLK
ncbi:hypothetical protein RN001_015278 [Aquatica leii]|uniref:EF-hand domain-containing protein n=1 Tax=Aquatica leii TaxID=1421715 RepID=A0AAN7NZ05_9COLE|nr:hypothetical protein RN001_015278 [Aquatica leii]